MLNTAVLTGRRYAETVYCDEASPPPNRTPVLDVLKTPPLESLPGYVYSVVPILMGSFSVLL